MDGLKLACCSRLPSTWSPAPVGIMDTAGRRIFSLSGLIVIAVAIPVMYVLSRRKLRLAGAPGGRALRKGAVESITCGWLAIVVVGALSAQLLVDTVACYRLASSARIVRRGKAKWDTVALLYRLFGPAAVNHYRNGHSC